jgi:hypothetical protein
MVCLPMKTRLLACLCLWTCGALSAVAAEKPSLAGRWKLNPALGSSLKPWDSETLVIAVQGDLVRIDRSLGWGPDRQVSDSTSLKTDGRTVLANPVAYWLDSWYNNAYIGGDHLKRVSGGWIESGRILKIETEISLDAQQGDFPVHIYDEYRVSADGLTLRLFELRSTRDQALMYVFTRE